MCFASTAHYVAQDKKSPQLSNLCGDFDANSDDDFVKIANSLGFIIERFLGLNIPDEYIRIWFSGGRSFHLEIPYQAFDIEPTVELNRLWQFIINGLNENLPKGCHPFDLNLYTNPRMLRLPNSYYPKYDAYKVELAHDEIHWPIGEIRQLAREPSESLYMEAGYDEYMPVGKAVDWYQEHLMAWKELRANRDEAIPVNPKAIKAISDVPVCVKDLRENAMARLRSQGSANKAQIHDATYSLAIRASLSEAIAYIESWIHSARPEYDNTTSVVKTIYANPAKYRFSCSLAWHLGLDCAKASCPLYQKHDLRKHAERVRRVDVVEEPRVVENAVSVSEARERMRNALITLISNWWQL